MEFITISSYRNSAVKDSWYRNILVLWLLCNITLEYKLHVFHTSIRTLTPPWHFWGLNVQLSDWTEVKRDLLLSPPTQHDTIRPFLTNKKPLFLSGKQNRGFIHNDPDYAQSSILSAQFKSKGNLDKNISSKELMIDFLYTRKSLWYKLQITTKSCDAPQHEGGWGGAC